MITASIDPGLKGAIAIFDGSKLMSVRSLPTASLKLATVTKAGNRKTKTRLDELAIKQLLTDEGIQFIFIEKAQTMRKPQDKRIQGVTSSGTTMENYGLIRGICVGLGIPYHEISPVTWKNAMLGKGYASGDKKVSIPHAERLTMVSMNDNHNWADSVLIGLYGINIMGGIVNGTADREKTAKTA